MPERPDLDDVAEAAAAADAAQIAAQTGGTSPPYVPPRVRETVVAPVDSKAVGRRLVLDAAQRPEWGVADSSESGIPAVVPAAPTGDGDTDTAALLTAIAKTISEYGVDGGPIWPRPGSYKLAATGRLDLPAAGALIGAGAGGRYGLGYKYATVIDATAMTNGFAIRCRGAGNRVEHLFLKGATNLGGSRKGGAVALDIDSTYTFVGRDVFIWGFTNQVRAEASQQILLENVIGYGFATHGLVAIGAAGTVRDCALSNGGAGQLAEYQAANYLLDSCTDLTIDQHLWDESTGAPNVRIVGTSRQITLAGETFYSNNSPDVVGMVIGDGINPVHGLKIRGLTVRPYQHENVAGTKGIVINANVIRPVLEDITTHTADDGFLGWYDPGDDIVDGGTDTVYRNVNGRSSVVTKSGAPVAADFDGLPVGKATGAIIDLPDGRAYYRLPDGTVRYATLNVPAAPVNTTAPAITGTTYTGQVLTCSKTGSWQNYPTSYDYQWKKNGANIAGATASTYTLVSGDVGASIKCTVTATNAGGSTAQDSNTVTPTAPVIDPATLSPALWLRPEELSALADSAAVATWDNIGSGADAAQSTTAAKPTLKEAIQNGRDIVRFDGGDFLDLGAGDFARTDDGRSFTVMFVCKTTASGFVIAKDAASGGRVYAIGDDPTSGPRFEQYPYAGVFSGQAHTSGFHVHAIEFTERLNANSYVDGALKESGGDLFGATGTTSTTIGRRHYSGAEGYWSGDLGEMLVFSTRLSAADRQSMEAYLKSRWATP